jgi:hypothetical protein
MNLRGIISMNEFYELTEEIAQLIDEKLNTGIEDLSNINDLIEKEIGVAYRFRTLKEKEEPLKSKLELYDKIGVPFTGGFPLGNEMDFGTSME